MNPAPPPPGRYPWGEAATPYEEVGGDAAVRALADAFYDEVEATAPALRAMLPDDTSGSRQKLYEFLSGWMGGPPLFWERRGHPALRMRHAPFVIGAHEASEWGRCMTTAIEKVGMPEQAGRFLATELGRAAEQLRNAGV
jgi:hemoglobin